MTKPKAHKTVRTAPDDNRSPTQTRNGFAIRTSPSNLVPQSEYSPTFIQGMIDRMHVSFFKYGKVADAYPTPVNAIESLFGRLLKYSGKDGVQKAVAAAIDKFERGAMIGAPGGDGNTEWMMDVANFAMIEYMRPRHPKAHFQGTDASASPGRAMDGLAFANPRANLDAK